MRLLELTTRPRPHPRVAHPRRLASFLLGAQGLVILVVIKAVIVVTMVMMLTTRGRVKNVLRIQGVGFGGQVMVLGFGHAMM